MVNIGYFIGAFMFAFGVVTFIAGYRGNAKEAIEEFMK